MSFNVGYQSSGQISIGPQDTPEPGSSEFNTTITPGALTVAGQSITVSVEIAVSPGTLTIAGQDFGLVIDNSLKQLVTVTDVSKRGTEITFYDVLSGVPPAIGDIWWVPTTSSDGGAFTLNGDGTFTLGTPTSGEDTLVDVMFYDISSGQWHGPADVTVQDRPNTLQVDPNIPAVFEGIPIRLNRGMGFSIGSATVAGQDIVFRDSLDVTPGALTIAGQDIVWKDNIAVSPGSLTVTGISGDINKVHPTTQGALSISGQDVTLRSGIKLVVEPGTLSLVGAEQRINSALEQIEPGTLTIAGRDIAIRSSEGFTLITSQRLAQKRAGYKVQVAGDRRPRMRAGSRRGRGRVR